MSKVELVASGDPHLCIDVQTPAGRHPETFYDEQRGKLAFIKSYCKENNIPWYVIPGDLLNYKNPSVYTSTSINSLVHELSVLQEDLDILSISGNHDLKMSSREMKAKSVYNIFAESGLLTDINFQTKYLAEDVTISGIDYNHIKENLLEEVRTLNSKLSSKNTNIVVLHEHLLPTGESLPFGQHINYDTFLEFTNIDVIISGHLHKGYPTTTIGFVDLDSDTASDPHEITFINPWALTRVARDHYALNAEHTPELVHLTIEDGKVSYKHVIIPHKSFETAFMIESLISEENMEVDISEFVSSLNEFTMEDITSTNVSSLDKSDLVKERINHYLQLAETSNG